jgi:hypothetical protein
MKIKLTGGVAIAGKTHKEGDVVEVSVELANDLLRREKAVLIPVKPEAEKAEKTEKPVISTKAPTEPIS